MSGYLQIEGDPTKWWLAQAIQPSQLTGQALSVEVEAPLAGTLLLSPSSASVAVFNEGAAPAKLEIPRPAIYVPTATGPSAGSAGFELPASADLAALAGEITTLMNNGGRQTIALDGYGGSLVLNGATVSFVVLCPATVSAPAGGHPAPPGGTLPAPGGGRSAQGSVPHDTSHG
jgi:hypothetical protein